MQLQRQSDREELTRLVAEGKHVTILGSSWNAIELANHLRSDSQKATRRAKSGKFCVHGCNGFRRWCMFLPSDVARQHGWSSSVTLIFPEAAPLAKQVSIIMSAWHWVYALTHSV